MESQSVLALDPGIDNRSKILNSFYLKHFPSNKTFSKPKTILKWSINSNAYNLSNIYLCRFHFEYASINKLVWCQYWIKGECIYLLNGKNKIHSNAYRCFLMKCRTFHILHYVQICCIQHTRFTAKTQRTYCSKRKVTIVRFDTIVFIIPCVNILHS